MIKMAIIDGGGEWALVRRMLMLQLDVGIMSAVKEIKQRLE